MVSGIKMKWAGQPKRSTGKRSFSSAETTAPNKKKI